MGTRLPKWPATLLLAVLTLATGAALQAQQLAPAPLPPEQPKALTIYVTRIGTTYHWEDGRYLSMSKIPISLKDAKARGYTACKVCPDNEYAIRTEVM